MGLIFVGDTGSGNKDQTIVGKAMVYRTHEEPIEAVIVPGDTIYDKGVLSVDDEQFQTKFEIPYADIHVPFYLCLGNHDYGNSHFSDGRWKYQIEYTKRSKKWRMPARYYWKSLGLCDVFFLDTNFEFMDAQEISEQLQAIKKMYAQSKGRWKILCGHHTWRSIGGHGNAEEDTFETFVQDLLGSCKFHLYVCGHDHCKNHSIVTLPNQTKVHNVVIGTGGQSYPSDMMYLENLNIGDSDLQFHSPHLGYMTLDANHKQIKLTFYGLPKNGSEMKEHSAIIVN